MAAAPGTVAVPQLEVGNPGRYQPLRSLYEPLPWMATCPASLCAF